MRALQLTPEDNVQNDKSLRRLVAMKVNLSLVSLVLIGSANMVLAADTNVRDEPIKPIEAYTLGLSR